jgi:hypothetical protein
MDASLEQTFQGKYAHGLAHRVPRHSQLLRQGNLLQGGPGAKLAVQDFLPEDAGNLVGDADAVNL